MKKQMYRTLYNLSSRLACRVNWKWLNRWKLFLGLTLVAFGVDANKGGKAEERSANRILFSGELSPGEIPLAAGDTIETDSSGAKLIPEEDTWLCYDISVDIPVFPLGDVQVYIMDHLVYPVEAKKNRIEGIVYIQFTVEKDGTVDEVKVTRPVHPLLDTEAVRVISGMPRWEREEGDFVNPFSYTVPVRFTLDSLQRDTLIDECESPFIVVEKMPVFPLGDVNDYLAKHIKYPAEAREKKIEGRVFVSFVIEKKGQLNAIEVVRPVHPLLDAEAIRVVKGMPRWIPGEQRGKKVRVSLMLPIAFSLKENLEKK